MLTIKWTTHTVDITFADAYNGPDGRGGGMNVNSTASWVRINGGRWYRCHDVSAHKVKGLIESFKGPAEELLAHVISGGH